MTTIEDKDARIKVLEATIAAAHDHLHNGRIDEAHEALHCHAGHDVDKPLPNQNITINAAATLQEFSGKFNELCLACGVSACWVSIVPSATVKGFSSIQIGGNVDTIQTVRQLMGAGKTLGVGNHKDLPSAKELAAEFIRRGGLQSPSKPPRPAVTAPVRRKGPIAGRNDPCPCGSGKKFKACCRK